MKKTTPIAEEVVQQHRCFGGSNSPYDENLTIIPGLSYEFPPKITNPKIRED
jgi:hypothetical protein